MKKLLITVTDPQESWLREEARRQDLPGGVSELMRRALDAYRRPKEIPMALIRKGLCNVIASHLSEILAFNDFDRAEIEQRARSTWEQVEVPGDDYPQHWTRYQEVELSESEVQYVLSQVYPSP